MTTNFSELFSPAAVTTATHEDNTRLAARLAALSVPDDLATARVAYAAGHAGVPVSPPSANAETVTIAGPGGDLELRILRPERVRGVYLHLHDGAWMLGTNDMRDERLEELGRETGLAAVSVDFRLAPEHPFPAAIDDATAAARWLVEHATETFGTPWLAIGGDSSGAHLAALVLLRLREEGIAGRFKAATLTAGTFDMSLTPSVRRATDTLVATGAQVAQYVETFSNGADLRDPAISPLYADLAGLPPALFTVGTLDPVLDDHLFMHMRWQAAGNRSELAVYPGGVHAFNLLGGTLGEQADQRTWEFLREQLGNAAD